MAGYSWEPHSAGAPIPEGTVRAGTDTDGFPIYVGRAVHEADLIPAKVIPGKNVAYVSHDGEEVEKYDYEVFRCIPGITSWEAGSNGSVPDGAVSAGTTGDGEILYYGRCCHQGVYTPGKVQVSHGCLYFPYDGQEFAVTVYEVLVLR